jgi:hypothetical protein
MRESVLFQPPMSGDPESRCVADGTSLNQRDTVLSPQSRRGEETCWSTTCNYDVNFRQGMLPSRFR